MTIPSNRYQPGSDIEANVRSLRDAIARVCARCGRKPDEVRIVAVSKSVSAERMESAFRAGCTDFGENRYQEASPKIERLESLGIRWHFLGRVQPNKLRKILEDFQMVQSMDRGPHIEKAEQILAESGALSEVCLQVNLSGGSFRGGVPLAEAERFFRAEEWTRFPHLKFRGLMALGPYPAEESEKRRAFRGLKRCFDRSTGRCPDLQILSMGMSDDFEWAIEEGSTMVRIGRLIFGLRPA